MTAIYTSSAGPAQPASSGKYQFSITGQVAGLYPGVVRPFTLSVYNPNHVAITVTQITATVGDASAACGAGNLQVTSFTGQLPVAAGGFATATVTAAMSLSSPDGCQGAAFPLHFAGQGQAP